MKPHFTLKDLFWLVLLIAICLLLGEIMTPAGMTRRSFGFTLFSVMCCMMSSPILVPAYFLYRHLITSPQDDHPSLRFITAFILVEAVALMLCVFAYSWLGTFAK